MQFTYQDPGTIPRDAVRFWCGDTDGSNPLLADTEIAFCLQQTGGDVLGAALIALRGLAAKFALIPNESVGPVSVQDGGVSGAIQKQIAVVKSQIALGATPEFGGVYVSDVRANACSAGIVQPAFTRNTLRLPNEPGTHVSNRNDVCGWLGWWE